MSAISCIIIALILVEIILFYAWIRLVQLDGKEIDEHIRLVEVGTEECLKRRIPIREIL